MMTSPYSLFLRMNWKAPFRLDVLDVWLFLLFLGGVSINGSVRLLAFTLLCFAAGDVMIVSDDVPDMAAFSSPTLDVMVRGRCVCESQSTVRLFSRAPAGDGVLPVSFSEQLVPSLRCKPLARANVTALATSGDFRTTSNSP